MKKNKKNENRVSRREFLGSSLAMVGGLGLAASTKPILGAPAIISKASKPDSMVNGVQLGVITYSYRSMEDQSAYALLQDIVNSGISTCELMGDPAEQFAGIPESPVDRRAMFDLRRQAGQGDLTQEQQQQMEQLQAQMEDYNNRVREWRASVSMDRFAELGRMFNNAGVSIYAWKPSALGEDNTDDEIRYALRAARAMGASACTVEHPGNDEQTKRLGDIAAREQTYVAYHAHTQATPTLWDTALEQSDYNAINLDIGHYVAGGNSVSPVDFIREKHERIESMHMKDRTTPANGAKNLLWGLGDTPLKEALQLMRDNGYTFPATIELEYQIPEGSDAVKECQRCITYAIAALNDTDEDNGMEMR